MTARIFSLALAFVVWRCVVLAEPVGSHPYEVDEAYEIYNELIPRTDTYVFSKGILIVEQRTSQQPDVSSACLTQEGSDKFAEAIADLSRVQRTSWLLQPRFHTAKPVQLVNSETIQSLFGEGEGGWNNFFKRYPNAGGYISLGPVGFNHDKTLAIVHVATSCRGSRDKHRFHLLQKGQGFWREVAGLGCSTGS
jgi:hypothetical protein